MLQSMPVICYHLGSITHHSLDTKPISPKSLGKVRIGYKDDHEINVFTVGDSLLGNSYQYYDWEVYIQNADSSVNKVRLFYKERTDKFSDTTALVETALARNPGLSFDLNKNPKQQLQFRSMYRILEIKDSNLTAQNADNTLLNRIDYRMKLLKGAISTNTFYEIGSGLELKREFAYIEVPQDKGCTPG